MNGENFTSKWTREELETDPGTTGTVWRQLIQYGPAPLSKFYEGQDWNRAREAARRLEHRGWVRRCGKLERELVFAANTEQDLGSVKPIEVLRPSVLRRKRLARCMALAKKARHSALAVDMAAALLEIECELRAIRDGDTE